MSWKIQYLSYDQDSLATFANAGLVRRALKDIDANKVSLQEEQPDQVLIQSDGQQVCLSATGLHQAQCSCPATGACKHIVAAVLWLQQNQQTARTAEGSSTEETTHSIIEEALPTVDVLAEMLALDLDQIAKKIGKAAAKKAIQWARQWQRYSINVSVEAYRVRVQLPELNEQVSYLAGAGFAGMLSDVKKDQPALHLAALSLVQFQHGKIWQQLELSDQENPALLSDSERQFIQELQQDLIQLLQQGLAHISSMTARQLHLLNVSARSEGLPRLAGMLRQLSGQVSALVRRDEHANERESLCYIVQMLSYLHQLQNSHVEHLIQLRGQSRQSYQHDREQADLDLLPLGARWWHTQGGARGLSLYFWEMQQQRPIDVTIARAQGQDPTFDRYRAWGQHSIWQHTAESLMQRHVCLLQPRFSEQGRLSSSGSSQAHTQLAQLSLEHYQPIFEQAAFQDWQQLQQHWQSQMQSVEGLAQQVLLKIARCDSPQVDEIEQCLWWSVYDTAENVLQLRLDWNTQSLERIRKLERLCLEPEKIVAVFASLSVQSHQLRLTPISLFLDVVQPRQVLFQLDFDAVPNQKKTLKDSIVGRIEQLLAKKKQYQQHYQLQQTLAQRLCEPVLDILCSLSSSGRLWLTDSQRQILQDQQQLAQQAGMSLLQQQLAQTLARPKLTIDHLVRLVYLCDMAMRMQVSLPIYIADEAA